MTDTVEERRVWQIVGGKFVPDSIGQRDYDRIVAAVRAAPQRHIAAFERLFLRERPNARHLTDLNLATFLSIVAPAAPREATRLARRLESMIGGLARLGEAEANEHISDERTDELSRRNRQLEMHRFNLSRIAGR